MRKSFSSRSSPFHFSSPHSPTQPRRSRRHPGSEADSGVRLPVKRVVLYKNGVGYFEHSARIHGNQDLSIDFTTAQLNDVLKSLTAVDLGEGHICQRSLQLHRARWMSV